MPPPTMTVRRRILSALVASTLLFTPAHALFNLNQGKDLVFASATYSIGYDSNVFTRASGRSSFTQSASAALDYTRQAGLIAVTANIAVSSGRFESLRGQDFFDPSIAISLRKRYGRTTGTWSVTGRRESQPDPDVGARTRSWNYGSAVDVRYPVNDRYYLTNNVRGQFRQYQGSTTFSDLDTFSDSFAINYIYTSKLDLNGAYTIGVSDTSMNTKAYDHSLTFGASGSILPKLNGTINVGLQRRNSTSTIGGRESFNSFTSGTTLKWLLSRRLTFNADLNESFSTTATDISVNRASAGLRTTASISSKYIANAGIVYTISDFLGKAGAGRHDDMFQFDASLGVAITTHIRTTLAYMYMINWSNFAGADFERQSLSLTVIATY